MFKRRRVLDSDDESIQLEYNKNDIIVISDDELSDSDSSPDSDDYSAQDLYIKQQINEENPYEKPKKTVREDCQDWINLDFPEDHNFMVRIYTDFLLNYFLESRSAIWEIPEWEIEKVSEYVGECDICCQTKTITLQTLLKIKKTDNDSIIKQCKFGCDCGLKVRLGYLYQKVIFSITHGYYVQDQHNNYTCDEIIDVFETLKEEASKIINHIEEKYKQNITEQVKSLETNQKRKVYYSFTNNLPCLY